MRGLDAGIGVGLAELKPSFHLKFSTKFSMFLLRAWGCSGIIGAGAGFLTSAGMGGCQIANRCVSTIFGAGGTEGWEGGRSRCDREGNDEREDIEGRDQEQMTMVRLIPYARIRNRPREGEKDARAKKSERLVR